MGWWRWWSAPTCWCAELRGWRCAWGLSPLVVGLTVVAFGTSAPEMAVSIGAALHGNDGLAVGNVVGSNIFNVLFILGLSALITPLAVAPAGGAPGGADHAGRIGDGAGDGARRPAGPGRVAAAGGPC